MRVRKGMTAGLMGLTLAAGVAASVAATPAYAYSPDPKVSMSYYDTSDCRCTNSDPFDGTVFQYDRGGRASKAELRHNGWFVGKVEFHPKDEQLWVYDTRNDNDTIWVRYQYWNADSEMVTRWVRPPGTSAVADKKVVDLNRPEGHHIWIRIYDRKGGDLIKSTYGET